MRRKNRQRYETGGECILKEIYLDNSATTQVDQDVAGIACEVMTEVYGNPSSPYLLGRDALGRLTAARQQVAPVSYTHLTLPTTPYV